MVEAKNGRLVARLTGEQGSGILTSMVEANALIVLEEDVAKIKKGDDVSIQWLDRAGA